MKKLNLKFIKEGLKLTVINLALLFVFLELGSLGFYFIRNQQFFYTREKSEDYRDLGINLEGVRVGGESIVERLHPFFGFVQKPGPDFRPGFKYNNYGFITPYDYPFVKTSDNQLIVGVFGGSVASNYSIYEVNNKVLEQIFRQIPEYKDKEIILLSFAIGGYKQPQQLLILNYMLARGQKFDLIINIDGFNEVALSNLNNQRQLDFAMPSPAHIEPLTGLANNSLSNKALRTLLEIKDNKEQLGDSIESLQDCKLASCYAVKSVYVQTLVKNYRENLQRFERYRNKPLDQNQESVIFFYSQDSVLPDAVFFEQVADYWAKTSILMHQVATANNIPYFHFFQPNQYWKTNRKFSEAEKKIALSEASPYEKGVKIGYPLLLERIDDLKANNVNIFNAVSIFDDVAEPVYGDNCCHYNAKGDEVFSNYIGRSIVETLTGKPLEENTKK
ncbi:hypothetical protein ACL6C3_05815 [Capilliphycus salinus ALCB114379]|uniref:hypothetical protein n=1 Tax=Capilliphycus salinus TaxID=2768948 RepID=UPI0039A6B151